MEEVEEEEGTNRRDGCQVLQRWEGLHRRRWSLARLCCIKHQDFLPKAEEKNPS